MSNSDSKPSQPSVLHISSATAEIVSPVPVRSTIITVDRLKNIAQRWEDLAATPHPSALVPGFAPKNGSIGGVPAAVRECTEGRDYTGLEDPTRFADSTRLQVSSRAKVLMEGTRCETPACFRESPRLPLSQLDPLDNILDPPVDGNHFSAIVAYAFARGRASAWRVAPAELEGMKFPTPYEDDIVSPVIHEASFWEPPWRHWNREVARRGRDLIRYFGT